jgi:acetyl-CoA carboxylase biotin carboxyl carrier protein
VRFGRRGRSLLSPDPDLVRTLTQLLAENGLTEIEYRVGDLLIRVSRSAPAMAVAPAMPAVPLTSAQEAFAGGPVTQPGAVTAPMVGTVYLAPQPGAPPFVRLGETVAPGQPLLIIEAMKVMNEIRAPRAGRIAQIVVAEAQPIEYGAVLMVIE